MKHLVVIAILILLILPQLSSAQEATLAWFTNANVAGTRIAKPADAQPNEPGSYLNGISLASSVGFTATALNQQNGMINFWIKPNWNGNDNQRHIFVKIGDPESNVISIEISEKNMLRFVITGENPVKVTALRHDVSNWEANKWHHVACSWNSLSGKPLGLGLWIDRVGTGFC